MRWSDFETSQPRFAADAARRLFGPGVVLVGSIRRDGTPRISPVEPLLWQGDVWLSMLLGSLKAKDLLRDERVLVHSIVTSREGTEGEIKVRGSAVAEQDAAVGAAYAAEVSRQLDWSPEPGHFHLFRLDIDDVTSIRYEHQTGDQFVARWPDGGEFVRRGTSATSLGDREPWTEALTR